MKKINWKVIAVLTVLCILGGAYTLAFADTSVDQKTTLNGVVLADGLAAVGMQVRSVRVRLLYQCMFLLLMEPEASIIAHVWKL